MVKKATKDVVLVDYDFFGKVAFVFFVPIERKIQE